MQQLHVLTDSLRNSAHMGNFVFIEIINLNHCYLGALHEYGGSVVGQSQQQWKFNVKITTEGSASLEAFMVTFDGISSPPISIRSSNKEVNPSTVCMI